MNKTILIFRKPCPRFTIFSKDFHFMGKKGEKNLCCQGKKVRKLLLQLQTANKSRT